MRKSNTVPSNGLLQAVAPAPNRASFLGYALAYVVRRAGGSGGSVYVHDHPSGQLRLATMVDARSGALVDPPLVELAPGEGVVGLAFSGGQTDHIVVQPELSEQFVRCSQTAGDHLRAIALSLIHISEPTRPY